MGEAWTGEADTWEDQAGELTCRHRCVRVEGSTSGVTSAIVVVVVWTPTQFAHVISLNMPALAVGCLHQARTTGRHKPISGDL